MTLPELLNARAAAAHPSRRCAPARYAEVRSTSDTSPHDVPPKVQNKPALNSAADASADATVTVSPSGSLTSHQASIEIP